MPSSHITNEQAMQELQDHLLRAKNSEFYKGVFMGAVGVYWRTNVISFDQYLQLTDHVVASVYELTRR